MAAAAALSSLFAAHAAPAVAARPDGHDRVARAAAPAPPTLVLERRGGAVRYGSAATLVATLTAAGGPLPGRELSLHSSSTLLGSGATDAAGKVAFKLKPQGNARYEARFTPRSPEDVAAYQAASSNPLDLVVRPLVRLRLRSPLRAGRSVVGLARERIRIRGTVAPYVEGQRVVVRVIRRNREIRNRSRSVVRSGPNGRFRLSLRALRRGRYTVRAVQPGNQVLGAGRSTRRRLLVVRASARPGSRGAAVRALQRRLAALGYPTRVNGFFGAGTGRAVLSFRKVNGMGRTPAANRAVFRRLARGGGRYRVRYPRAGKHVEFDWSRQVLVLARGSRPVMTLHASSGKASTPTVFGRFRFYSKSPGFNSKGMYYSNYFIGGYAIHGYGSVPTYPASHGCIRIPIASAIRVYRWIDRGNPIYVYR